MWKPRHTTENCRSRVVAFLLIYIYGCPVTNAITRPSNRAIGGSRNKTEMIMQLIKISCR